MDLTAFAFIFYTNITGGYTGTDKSLHPRIFNTHNLPAKKPPQLQRLNNISETVSLYNVPLQSS